MLERFVLWYFFCFKMARTSKILISLLLSSLHLTGALKVKSSGTRLCRRVDVVVGAFSAFWVA